jgi:hypothetical protein
MSMSARTIACSDGTPHATYYISRKHAWNAADQICPRARARRAAAAQKSSPRSRNPAAAAATAPHQVNMVKKLPVWRQQ